MGTLSLAENAYHLEAIGETVYNSYTDVIYVFPDSICNNLLSVMRNRYVKTETAVPYNEAIYLENTFAQKYPEKPDNGNGVQYYIRTSTQQINSSIAGNFVLQATMISSLNKSIHTHNKLNGLSTLHKTPLPLKNGAVFLYGFWSP